MQPDCNEFLDPTLLIHTDCASRLSQKMSPIWHNEDLWIVIMSFLESKDLLRLALTNRCFYKMAINESVWKLRCLKELDIPDNTKPTFSWRSLFAVAVDGSHSYSRRDCKAHIDWMRIGFFSIESGEAIATDGLRNLKNLTPDDENEEPLTPISISNVKNGPWIADLHLLRCLVCDEHNCGGTVQTLEARHWELFLYDKLTEDDWNFEEIATRTIRPHALSAGAGVFDKRHVFSKDTLDLLSLNLWNSSPGDCQPRGKASKYAAAASTWLQQNDGLQAKFYTMRDASDGLVVGIRVTQKLA